jgi:phage/plasmid-associated DNA primase
MTVTREHILCLVSDTHASEAHVIEMTVGEYLASHPAGLGMYRLDGSRFTFDITHVPGPQPYFGFQTDGNQRFCLADGTVTHNSTIVLKIAKQFYEAGDVGILSNNMQQNFGLSAFYDKLLFVAPEIKSDLRIEQAEFQSIVSGEDISINIKHKTAISVMWTVPGVLAGNEVPGWIDNSGSIQRRILLFDFPRPVTNGDMKLGEKLERELPAIILKCNRAYLKAAAQWGSANIWTVLPRYFLATRDEMAQATNVLEAFLASHEVVLGKDHYIPLDEFKMALKMYSQANNYKQMSRYTAEFFRGSFEKAGISKVRDAKEYRGRRLTRDFLLGVDLSANTAGSSHEPNMLG